MDINIMNNISKALENSDDYNNSHRIYEVYYGDEKRYFTIYVWAKTNQEAINYVDSFLPAGLSTLEARGIIMVHEPGPIAESRIDVGKPWIVAFKPSAEVEKMVSTVVPWVISSTPIDGWTK